MSHYSAGSVPDLEALVVLVHTKPELATWVNHIIQLARYQRTLEPLRSHFRRLRRPGVDLLAGSDGLERVWQEMKLSVVAWRSGVENSPG